jgi:hypothetical protein
MRPQPRTVQDEWAQRIRSETVINLIALGRDDEALARLDDWLADLPKLYAPWLYRADLRRRRDGAVEWTRFRGQLRALAWIHRCCPVVSKE